MLENSELQCSSVDVSVSSINGSPFWNWQPWRGDVCWKSQTAERGAKLWVLVGIQLCRRHGERENSTNSYLWLSGVCWQDGIGLSWGEFFPITVILLLPSNSVSRPLEWFGALEEGILVRESTSGTEIRLESVPLFRFIDLELKPFAVLLDPQAAGWQDCSRGVRDCNSRLLQRRSHRSQHLSHRPTNYGVVCQPSICEHLSFLPLQNRTFWNCFRKGTYGFRAPHFAFRPTREPIHRF